MNVYLLNESDKIVKEIDKEGTLSIVIGAY